MKSRVFHLQPVQNMDLSDAERFGRLVELSCTCEDMHRDQAKFLARLKSLLSLYSEGDYFLPVGDPTAVAVAATILSDISRGRFRLLKWDRDVRRYFPVQIDLTPISHAE